MARQKDKMPKYINFPIECLKGKSLRDGLNEGIYYALGYFIKGYDCKDYRNKEEYYITLKNDILDTLGITVYSGWGIYLDTCREYERKALTGCPKDIAFSLQDGCFSEPYSEMLLRAYLALKSIIPAKKYAKTNKAMLCARMVGFLNATEFHKFRPKLGMEYERIFSNRRTWQKFIKDMCERWHLGYYGRAQGFYVSFALSGTGIKKQIETKKKKLNEAMGKAEE